MTPAQADLLRRLIEADRAYRSRLAARELVGPDDRGLEVCALQGVDPRTARSLVAAGLAEMLDIGRTRSPWLFLGNYAPNDAA